MSRQVFFTNRKTEHPTYKKKKKDISFNNFNVSLQTQKREINMLYLDISCARATLYKKQIRKKAISYKNQDVNMERSTEYIMNIDDYIQIYLYNGTVTVLSKKAFI